MRFLFISLVGDLATMFSFKSFFELEVGSKEGFGLKLQNEGFGETIKNQEVRDGPMGGGLAMGCKYGS